MCDCIDGVPGALWLVRGSTGREVWLSERPGLAKGLTTRGLTSERHG